MKYAAAVVLWLCVWQAGSYIANRHLLIPIPDVIGTAKALVRLGGTSSFWSAALGSVIRVAIGFFFAVILGSILAVASSRYRWFKILTAPLISLIRAIPVASFTILVFLWISREKIPSVISFLTVLPIIWANMESGLASADHSLIEMAKVFGMKSGGILTKIILPGIRPHFNSAFVSGLGFAWKSGVAAEVICRTGDSLGNMLWSGKTSVDYDEVFALTLVIVLLSALIAGIAKRTLLGRENDKI